MSLDALPSFAALSKTAKIRLWKKKILRQKSPESFWFFFSIKNKSLGAHFLLKLFLLGSILKPLYLLKACPIFDEAAKLCKASKDAYN